MALQPFAVGGEAGMARQLTCSQAVERAVTENKSLAAARSLIAQAEARRLQAGKLADPELKLEYLSAAAFGEQGESGFGLGVSQSFPVTRRIAILRSLAEVEIALAEAEARNEERLLVRDVELLCNELAYLDAQIELRQSMVEVDEEFAAFVESRVAAAEASPVDAAQIRIELYALQQEIDGLRIERSKGLARFRSLLGLSPSESLELMHRFGEGKELPELRAFNTEDLNTHPEYVLRQVLLELAEGNSHLLKASRWEDLSVGLSFEEERSWDEPVGIGRNRFVGISISVPLPLRDRSRGRVEESLSIKDQRVGELAAIALELLNEAEALRQEAINRFSQAEFYAANITKLVEQNLEEMSHAYSAGQISLSELFRSQSQALRIRSTQLEMRREYEQALVRWKAATARNF